MSFYITTATKKIFSLTKRIKVLQGGTSAGKTIGILEVLIDRCENDRRGDITSIVSESLPHLKKGAIRDFISIMESSGRYEDSSWNRTDFHYTFPNGAILEFFSVDEAGKVRGPRRKRLFINEADRITYETFEQLEVRTTDEIFIDYNPVAEFWAITELPKRDDSEKIILTYLDNEALNENIVKAIEQRKGNKTWWKVYGEGQLGEIEGKIYSNWQLIDEVPKEARLERRYLDYGYTNDPTAIGDIYKWNDAWVIDEQLYQTGMLNNQIRDFIKNLAQQVPVAADSAEPKSNDELALGGITILPARKGKDSVNNGINLVQQQKIFITKRSRNIWKEYLSYLWITDKDGKVLNVPIGTWNHHMDGIRYGFESLLLGISSDVVKRQLQRFERVQGSQSMNSTK